MKIILPANKLYSNIANHYKNTNIRKKSKQTDKCTKTQEIK